MTALEATVEIVKAALLPGGASTAGSSWLVTDEEQTKKLADSIAILHEKFRSLEQKK